MISIDLREQYIDLPAATVITRDNVDHPRRLRRLLADHRSDQAVYEMNDLIGGIVQ